MQEPKVAEEVAEAEFDRLIESSGIDIDEDDFDEEDRKGYEKERRKLIKAIMKGSLVVDEHGRAQYTPQHSEADESLVFYPPTGADLQSMDSKPRGHDMTRTFALLGAITKQPAQRFSKMHVSDLAVCKSILILFFQSQ